MEARVQAITDRYFGEYQQQCFTDIEGMKRELAVWEAADATILDISLEEQAKSADYVTRKICSEQPEDIVVHFASTMLDEIPPGHKLNSCAIGNSALLVQTVLGYDGHETLKERLELEHAEMIAGQREIRRNPPPANNGGGECSVQ